MGMRGGTGTSGRVFEIGELARAQTSIGDRVVNDGRIEYVVDEYVLYPEAYEVPAVSSDQTEKIAEKKNLTGLLFEMIEDRVVDDEKIEKVVDAEANDRIVRTMTRIQVKNHEGKEEDAISENLYLIKRENGKLDVKIWAGVNYREGTEEYDEADKLLRRAG